MSFTQPEASTGRLLLEMAVGFRRKERLKLPNSKLSSPMVSTSSTRSKPLAFSRLNVYVDRIGHFPSALVVVIFLVFIVYLTWKLASSQVSIPQFYSYDIVNEFPHDPQAFTQGLLYNGNDTLLESTGLYGKSTVRKVDLQSGKVELSYKMGKSLFGEGLTLFGDRNTTRKGRGNTNDIPGPLIRRLPAARAPHSQEDHNRIS